MISTIGDWVKYPEIEWAASDEAREMVEKGFVGNGCGSAGTRHKKLLAFVLGWVFGFDLKTPCDWHDAEYSLSRTIKSRPRKLQADIDLQINLETRLQAYPDALTPRRRFLYQNVRQYRDLVDWAIRNIPRLFHGAVVAGGFEAYWS